MTGAYERDHILSVSAAVTIGDQALIHCEFETKGRGVLALYGRSGAGKSTLLRAIAGLTSPSASKGSRVSFAGDVWQAEGTFKTAELRGVGLVFQDQQLLPHLSVRGNLQYASKRAHQPTGVKWEEVVQATGIDALLDRHPATLSGGEQQRVGLARTLINQPRLLLLDEPLASLDPAARQQLMSILLRVKAQFEIPMIYVSHRWDEVIRLADDVLWLENGQVKQYASLSALAVDFEMANYQQDEAACLLVGRAVHTDLDQALTEIEIGNQSMWVPDPTLGIHQTHRLLIRIQNVGLSLIEQQDSSVLNSLRCKIVDIELGEATALVRLDCEGQRLLAQVTRRSCERLSLAKDLEVFASIKASVLS